MKISSNSQTRDTWMSLVEDFHAKTSALQEVVWVSTEAALDYGVRCIELYGKLDLDMSSLRTAQLSFFEDSNGSYAIFPKSGMMRNGNVDFGFDHRRERLYVIAYSNKVKRQAGRFQEWNQAQGIFVPPSNQHCGFSIAQRVLEMPDREHIGINDGIRGWTHRVGCLGNAVNPVVAKYLFECIILYENKISKRIK